MTPVTEVILLTGFLGSGKTTLLNHMLQSLPPDLNVMVLMNEFGDLGIDGQLIDGPEGMELMEISRGSVFCVCVKTDFIKALAAIAGEIRPDLLIIEATGTANPTDIGKDLNLPIFKNRFHLREQICLLDAENFMATYAAFASLEKQIAAATCFIINKTDLAPPEEIDAIQAAIAEHNPHPQIQTRTHATTFARIPLDTILAPFPIRPSKTETAPSPSPETVEQTIADLLADPFGAMSPPDELGAALYRWTGDTLSTMEQRIARIPRGIVRAKGFLRLDNRIHLFSRVMQTHTIALHEGRPIPPPMINRIVFIGPPEALKELKHVTKTDNHLQLEVERDPFAVSCG